MLDNSWRSAEDVAEGIQKGGSPFCRWLNKFVEGYSSLSSGPGSAPTPCSADQKPGIKWVWNYCRCGWSSRNPKIQWPPVCWWPSNSKDMGARWEFHHPPPFLPSQRYLLVLGKIVPVPTESTTVQNSTGTLPIAKRPDITQNKFVLSQLLTLEISKDEVTSWTRLLTPGIAIWRVALSSAQSHVKTEQKPNEKPDLQLYDTSLIYYINHKSIQSLQVIIILILYRDPVVMTCSGNVLLTTIDFCSCWVHQRNSEQT